MRRLGVVTWLVVGLAGCNVSYRSSAGTATAPEGFGPGVGRSIVFGDEGGLLSRLGLGALGTGLAGAGALGGVKVVKSETDVSTNGNTTTITTRDTVEIDRQKVQEGAAGGMTLVRAADSGKLSSAGGGLAANLEIASRSFGGDTSGWQYDMGYAFRKYRRGDSFVMGLRGYVGFGYGKFTIHDRVLDRVDRGPPMFDSAETKFLGLPTRFGLFMLKKPSSFDGMKSLKEVWGTETYVRANLNLADGPHRFHLGQRLQWALVFVELEASIGGFDTTDRSLGLAVGLGI